MLLALISAFILALIFSFFVKLLLNLSTTLLDFHTMYFIHPMMTVIWLTGLTALGFALLQWLGITLEQRQKIGDKPSLFLKIFSKISGRPGLAADCLKSHDPALQQSTLNYCQRQDKYPLLVLEFCIWLLPLLGFIGTIIGISGAMEKMAVLFTLTQENNFTAVLNQLATAFYTTLFALVAVIPLMILLYILQAETEKLHLLRQASKSPEQSQGDLVKAEA